VLCAWNTAAINKKKNIKSFYFSYHSSIFLENQSELILLNLVRLSYGLKRTTARIQPKTETRLNLIKISLSLSNLTSILDFNNVVDFVKREIIAFFDASFQGSRHILDSSDFSIQQFECLIAVWAYVLTFLGLASESFPWGWTTVLASTVEDPIIVRLCVHNCIDLWRLVLQDIHRKYVQAVELIAFPRIDTDSLQGNEQRGILFVELIVGYVIGILVFPSIWVSG